MAGLEAYMAGKADLVNGIVDRIDSGIVSPVVLLDSGDPDPVPVPAPGGTAPLDPFGSAIQ